MIRAYYTANIVPQGAGSGNFSIDLWNNAKDLRFQMDYISKHFKDSLMLYSPYRRDMFVRAWENEMVSTGEISQFTEDILDMCDVLVVGTDPEFSGEVSNDIDTAMVFGITIVYLHQHNNMDDKINELESILVKLDVPESEV